MASKIPPMCPSLTAWLDQVSTFAGMVGGASGFSPAKVQTKNVTLLATLVARNGFDLVVDGWGKFEGPFGLTMQDAVLLMNLKHYMQGHMDANGMAAGEQSQFILSALETDMKRLATEFGALVEKDEKPNEPKEDPNENHA